MKIRKLKNYYFFYTYMFNIDLVGAKTGKTLSVWERIINWSVNFTVTLLYKLIVLWIIVCCIFAFIIANIFILRNILHILK
jgi:hypothetical protein